MSGGELFDYTYPDFQSAEGRWGDEEVNELYHDLFIGEEFSIRGYDGLMQSLDFWLSGDVCEETYREKLAAFKAKWLGRTPEDRLAFYQAKLQERCDQLKWELGACAKGGEDGQ